MSEQRKTKETTAQQSMEDLQKRYQQLNTKKIQAETNLDNAKKQLEDLKREAREKYQTDDVIELRAKLAKMTAENEEKRSKYQQDLDRIEADLQSVEEKFAETEKPSAGAAEKG